MTSDIAEITVEKSELKDIPHQEIKLQNIYYYIDSNDDLVAAWKIK